MRSISLSLVIVAIIVFFSSFAETEKKPRPYIFPELLFFPKMPLEADNPVTIEGAELGRYLFYDKLLSDDYTRSCASCHRQEKAFSDATNAFSKGKNEILTKRNSMPLFNLAWYPAFFWDGRAKSIENLVFEPVRHQDELNLSWNKAVNRLKRSSFYRKKFNAAFGEQPIDSVLVSKAIGQFLRTLLSYRSKFDLALAGKLLLSFDELKGFELMNDMTKGDCMHCHSTDADVLGTVRSFSNNGLDAASKPENYTDAGLGAITKNSWDYGKFKIPSLRNLAFTAPYMHDGRFKSLEEVLDFYGGAVKPGINTDSKMGFAHQGGNHLTTKEKGQIIAFLHAMSDSVFTLDPAFSNPFKK